jgi:hypothetical protein
MYRAGAAAETRQRTEHPDIVVVDVAVAHYGGAGVGL